MSQIKNILADLNEKLAKAEAGVAAWQEDVNRIKAAIALIASYDVGAKAEKPKKVVKEVAAKKPVAKKAVASDALKEVKKARAPHAKKLPIIRQSDWVSALAAVAANGGSAGPAAIAVEVARALNITGDDNLKVLKGRASPAIGVLIDQKKVKRVGEGQYALV